MQKVQEAGSILRLGFALSKRPHFNSVYLVRVPFLTGIAVSEFKYGTFKIQEISSRDQPAKVYSQFGLNVGELGHRKLEIDTSKILKIIF